MKLIIDISDNLYDVIKYDKYGLHKGKLYDIIRNGIPLDKIRAEIEENIQECVDKNKYLIATGLGNALDIIDKYKTESEEVE